MCKSSIVVAIVLLFASSHGSAETIYIGNSTALESWDRAAARVLGLRFFVNSANSYVG